MRYLPSKKHERITRVVNADDKVVALIGSIKDLTNANIIKWCDCADVEKFIIILATEIEKNGAHQNGKLFNTEAECIAECELIFLNAIFL